MENMGSIDLEYRERSSSQTSHSPIHPGCILASEIFLPAHLRLGCDNWPEFRLAIETVLRVKGLPLAHLKNTARPRHCPESGSKKHDRWSAEDELCKAIILLNVRGDHARLVGSEHERWSAAEVWGALEQRDVEIQECVREKREWLGRVYMGLLGAACVVLCLMVQQLWWVCTDLAAREAQSPYLALDSD